MNGDNQRRIKNGRRTGGQMMAALDLMIVIPIMSAGGIFVLDSALGGYYKQNVGFIVNQAANYAVNLPPNEDAEKPTQAVTKELFKKFGLAASDLKITVEKTTIAEEEAITVTASGNLPLIKGTMLPISISMKETATAMVPANRVCALVAINPYPYSYQSDTGTSVFVPIVRPSHPLPIWQFPYDTAINNLHIMQGTLPPTPSLTGRNSYYAEHPSLY